MPSRPNTSSSTDLDLPLRRRDLRKPRNETDNLFFCLLAETSMGGSTTALAHRLRARHGLMGRPQPPERLHVSLCSLGAHVGLPKDLIGHAKHAGEAVKAKAFDLTFDRFISFRGGTRSPLVLLVGEGSAALAELQHSLASALRNVGLKQPHRAGYVPHCTLLYDQRALPETTLDNPVVWRVRELALVHSLLGRGRYLHPGRWNLGG